MDKEVIYWEIPRIPENEPIFKTNIDWEKEETELKKNEEASQSKSSMK